MPEYKEIHSVILEDLEEVEDGKLCPIYQFGEDDPEFASEEALAVLLMDRVVFLNAHHWREDWPEDAKKTTSIFVNSSDVFVWGCADAEELPFSELESLYKHYSKDKSWGSAVWCIKQIGRMPQRPVYEAIQKEGIWDLDTMELKPSIDDEIKAENEAKETEENK